MKKFGFEKLKVWQKSRNLSYEVYTITVTFPEEEKFGLISQMRRAAISISSNIAEGVSRKSKKEAARFSEIAYGSAMELVSQSILSLDLEYISKEEYVLLRNNISEITAMIHALRKSQLK